jgi:hypothetical protein
MTLSSFLCALCASVVVLSGCGDPEPSSLPPLTPEQRTLLQAARDRALRDSVDLAAASFHADGAMLVQFGQDDRNVSVVDSFRLRKEKSDYQTEITLHRATGDTTLLNDMYTFRDSKGNPRAGERSQLTGLHFGTDFLDLLRVILSPDGNGECAMENADTLVSGLRCRAFRFRTEEKSGQFWLDGDSLGLVRLEVEQGSDYWVGSYRYRMFIDYARPVTEAPLPVRTLLRFDYSRLFSSGTGAISVDLSNIAEKEE